MEVRCAYETVINNYCCYVGGYQIPANVELKFVGNHKEGKTDNDVKCIHFSICNITNVPQGLTKQFPNLEILKIYGSGGNLKNVSRSDLIEYNNLKEIKLSSNNIEFLPGDLFEGFENLERIFLHNNNLQIVEPNILDGLENLKNIDLSGFLEYGEENVQSTVLYSNPNLKKIKSALLNKFMQNDVKMLTDFVEKLQIKVQIAKKFNKNLVKENEKIAQKCQELEHEKNRLVEENQDLKNLLEQREHLNQEIQELKNQQIQSDQEKFRNQQNYLELAQKYSNLEEEFAAGIIKEQQNIQKFCSDIKNFIQDETTKDFQIQINNREFPVHKFLLAARSPTLAEIFKKNPEVENLNLVDISVEIFEIILKFLYTDELPGDNGMNFLHLFAAAGKLKIQELKDFAAEKNLELITAENALEILNLSNKYEHDELKLKAFEEIKRNYPKMMLSNEIIDDSEKVEKLIVIIKKIEEMEKSLGSLLI